MQNLIGLDIGGTKCAVILGKTVEDGSLKITGKKVYPTKDFPLPSAMIPVLENGMKELLDENGLSYGQLNAIGVSCGGPLSSRKGIIMSPPNLPGWDDVHVVEMLKDKYGVRTALQNDANACALAEWKFGAGMGYSNVVFLTFGTGMGAGLILNGSLYEGTNDNAGEVGHIRLESNGPVGYGKAGSFEGFCSGGGIAQLGRTMALEKLQMGKPVSFCKSIDELGTITAKSVAEAALAGDPLAAGIYSVCGTYLGKGLAVIIDVLNPEVIILGSIFVRSADLLKKSLEESLAKESLSAALETCKIVPAKLEENLGDYAALSVAFNAIGQNLF